MTKLIRAFFAMAVISLLSACGGGGGSFIVGNDLVFRVYASAVSTPTTNYFSLTAKDTKTGASLTTFNATVNGTVFSTTNGTVVTTFNSSTGNVTIEVNATNYNSNGTSSWNMSLANYTGNLTPFFAVNLS